MSICPINYFVAKSSASSFAATVQSHYPLFSIDFMMRVTPCMRWFFEQNTDEGITFFDYILFYRPLGKQQDRIRRVEQESRILFHWIPSSYVYLKSALEERETTEGQISPKYRLWKVHTMTVFLLDFVLLNTSTMLLGVKDLSIRIGLTFY